MAKVKVESMKELIEKTKEAEMGTGKFHVDHGPNSGLCSLENSQFCERFHDNPNNVASCDMPCPYEHEFVNLTPHSIVFLTDDNNVKLTVQPSGQVARCKVSRQAVACHKEINVNKVIFGGVTGLPEPKTATVYIVSSLVAQAVPERTDVVIPDDTVRDDEGKIIGCRAVACV